MSVVVGVDSSTQSCKVELRQADDGRLLGFGTAPHSPAFAPRSEQNPSKWWSAFEIALASAVETSGVDRGDIAAISVAAQCHGLVALDANGCVIRPAKLWNDTQSAPQLDRLREQIGAAAWIHEVGSLPTSAFTISKLAWLAENEPENFSRLSRICLPHDWLTLCLCGRHVTDRSEASGTGYWSAASNHYVTEYLALIDPNRDWLSMLPEILGPEEAAGPIHPDTADALGLGREVVIGPGGGDQHAAGLGLAIETGDIVYTVATSGVVFTTSPDPVFDVSGLVDGVADCTGGYLPLVSTLNAARVTDWAASLLDVKHEELSRMALSVDPLRSPVFAAFLDGERKPNRPNASGLLAGLTSGTTRAGFARAVYDGVLLGLMRGEKSMNAAGIQTSGRVIITGGGARSPAYQQILSDLTGREVETADPTDAGEATARGAALQAASVLSGESVRDVRRAWAPRTEIVATPRDGISGLSENLLEKYLTVADWTGFDGHRP